MSLCKTLVDCKRKLDDFEGALKDCEIYISHNNDNPKAYFYISDCKFELKDSQEEDNYFNIKAYGSTFSNVDLVNDADVSANVMDVINCRENTYIKNEDMKRDIVTNPVKEEYGQFDLSWEKINKSSSIIMKMSVQKGFLNWLFNKK